MKKYLTLAYVVMTLSLSCWAGPAEDACAVSLNRTAEIYTQTGGSKDIKTSTMLGTLTGISAKGLKDMRASLRAELQAKAEQWEAITNDEEREFQKAQLSEIRAAGRQKGDFLMHFQDEVQAKYGILPSESEDLLVKATELQKWKKALPEVQRAVKEGRPPISDLERWSRILPPDHHFYLAKTDPKHILDYLEQDIRNSERNINGLLQKRGGAKLADFEEFMSPYTGTVRAQTMALEDKRIKNFMLPERQALIEQINIKADADSFLFEQGLMKKVASELPTNLQERTIKDEIDHLKGEQVRLEGEMDKLRAEITEGGDNVGKKARELVAKSEAFGANESSLAHAANIEKEHLGKPVKWLLGEADDTAGTVEKFRFSVLSRYLPKTPTFGKLVRAGIPVAGIFGAVALSGYFAEGVGAAGISEAFKNDPRKLVDMVSKKQVDVKTACLEVGRLPMRYTNQLNEIVNHYSMLANNRGQPMINPILLPATMHVGQKGTAEKKAGVTGTH